MIALALYLTASFEMRLTIDGRAVTALPTVSSGSAFPCFGCVACDHVQVRPRHRGSSVTTPECLRGTNDTATFCLDSTCFESSFACCAEYSPEMRARTADGVVNVMDVAAKLGARYVAFTATQTKALVTFALPETPLRWTRPIVARRDREIPVTFDFASSRTLVSRRRDTVDLDPVPCAANQTAFRIQLSHATIDVGTHEINGRCAGIARHNRDAFVLGTNAFRNNVVVFDRETGLIGVT